MAYKNLNGKKLEVTTYIKNPATGTPCFYKSNDLATTLANADQTLEIIDGGMPNQQPPGTTILPTCKLIIKLRYTITYDAHLNQIITKEYELI